MEIGAVYNEATSRVEGNARFYIDIKTLPVSARVFIQAAVAIPVLRTHALVDIDINAEEFSFKAELSLFDGFFNPSADVEFRMDMSYFRASFTDIVFFGGILILEEIFFLVDARGAPTGNVVAFKAEITVLFLLGIDIEWSVTTNKQEGYMALDFSVTLDLALVAGTVSGNARVSWSEPESRRGARMLQVAGSNPIASADWDVDFEPSWPAWLEDIAEAVVEFFKDAWNGLKNVMNEVAEVAKAAWNAVVGVAKAIGGFIKGIVTDIADRFKGVEDLGDAVAVFGNLVYDAGKAIAGFAKDVFNGVKEFFGDAINKASELFSDGVEKVDGWISNAFGGNDGEIRRINSNKRDETWNCLTIDVEESDCTMSRCCKWSGWNPIPKCSCCGGRHSKGISCCKWVHVRNIPRKDCVERRKKEIRDLEGEFEYSDDLYDCKDDTLDNSKGLEWAGGDGANVDVAAKVTPDEKVNIGKLSSIEGNNGQACSKVGFGIEVNKLATNSPGTTGQKENSSFET